MGLSNFYRSKPRPADIQISRPIFRRSKTNVLISKKTTSIYKPRHGDKRHGEKRDVFQVVLVHSSTNVTIPMLLVAGQILAEHAIPYQLSNMFLYEDQVWRDGHESFDEAVTQLNGQLESIQRKRDKAKILKRRPLPHLLILADSLGSFLMKGVAFKGSPGIPTDTRLLLFFKETEELTAHQRISESVAKVNADFDNIIRQDRNHALSLITWEVTLPHCPVAGDIQEAITGPLERAVRGLYPLDAHPSPLSASCHLYADTLGPVASVKPSLQLSGVRRHEESLTTLSKHIKPRLPGLGLPSSQPNESTGGYDWKDLRDKATSCLESGDAKLAFTIFQTCLAMEIPNDTEIWKIKTSMAIARMILGQYLKAEDELRQSRNQVHRYPYKKPTMATVHGTILLKHALALSRLSQYKEVESCLGEILLENGRDSTTKEQQIFYMHSATVCQLQALAVAHREFLSPYVDKRLNSAFSWLEKLQDTKLYEPTVVSCIFTKCRILTLRGQYAEALSHLQPALLKAISDVGDTNILTIEVALLFSFLQIETGRFREGRLTCQRCADVIANTFGNEHPLALEAEHILISTSHREGLLLTALDDSISLCHRAQSSVNLGKNSLSVLRYMTQLGEIHIECGQYSSAENILKEVCTNAESLWQSPHPGISKVQSLLALAQCYAGKLDVARTKLLTALRDQFTLNLYIRKDDPWPLESDEKISSLVLSVLCPKTDSKSAVHTDVLHSLLTYSRILSSPLYQNYSPSLQILKLAHDLAMVAMGGSHPLPLMASLMIGDIFLTMAMGQAGDNDLYSKALSSFDWVIKQKDEPLPLVKEVVNRVDSPGFEYTSRHRQVPEVNLPEVFTVEDQHHKSGLKDTLHNSNITNINTVTGDSCHEDDKHRSVQVFMTDHPVVSSARQGLIFTCMLSLKFGIQVRNILDCRDKLGDILAVQRIKPGQGHRHTVKTLLSLLALELSFTEPSGEVAKIYEELVMPLGRKNVEHERFLECLLLRGKVASILSRKPDVLKDEYRDLLGNIKRQIGEVKDTEDESIRDIVSSVEDRMTNILRDL